MKQKVYIADINSIITERLNNATLIYPKAHKDSSKPGCFYTYITPGTNYIAIGNQGVNKGDFPEFGNWDEAIEYAKLLKSMTTGKYLIGIRSAGKQKYNAVAKFNY